MDTVTQAAPTPSLQTADRAALLSVRNLAKSFGANPVLRTISLDVAQGEFLTILGESGSGKTTLLRIIAGFEHADSGEIWMEGQRLDDLPPYRRRVNTVFQHYALFPHLTVAQNVGYGLRVAKLPGQEIAGRVEQALAMVKMAAYARSKPAKISGGQQQRVALARALVNRPRLLLLDEPLSALDASLRRQVQVELKSLQREVNISFVFVTHDQDEAMVMSDRIALLRMGHLEQVASPREIYGRPATAYAAQFIGQTNLLRGEVKNGIAHCHRLSWSVVAPDGPRLFSLRPENIRFVEPGEPGPDRNAVRVRGTISQQSFHGATAILQIDCRDGLSLAVRAPAREDLAGEVELELAASDAVPIPDSNEKN
jgi:spermidine/putrescine transport system ATP-binding protein